MYLQDFDRPYWPEARDGEALYVHRLAVCRAHGGRGLSRAMLDWAAAEARRSGRTFVRLDTELRPALIALYENAGFARVDKTPIQVGIHTPPDRERFRAGPQRSGAEVRYRVLQAPADQGGQVGQPQV